MCGIAGLVNWGDDEALRRMTDVQAHRGPDDSGVASERLPDGTWVGLGSRRLAILDLSPAGHMPMSTPDGTLTIVYNGEVYNYPALRRDLEARGCEFRSTCDTEAVLYAYREYGPEGVRRLNGMFAFAILDRRRQELFLARDHFGIKPLYYCHREGRLAFASEAKAFLDLPGFSGRVDYAALQQYLTFLWVPGEATLLEGVCKLPPGHAATFRGGRLEVAPYWDLEFPDAGHVFPGDEGDLAAELRERFVATVHSQMMSDVPLGAFLSAGLDSSGVVAAMAQAGRGAPRTFTIAFPERHRRGETTMDDTAVARRTAEHFGCRHTEILVEPDAADLLPKLVWHMDEPTADPAIITAYFVNREARKDTTVLLSGVGGDEIFGGYRKYQAHYLAETYRKIPRPLRSRVIEPLVGALPSFRGTPLKGHVRLAKKMARSGSLNPRERFIEDCVYMNRARIDSLCAQPLRDAFAGLRPDGEHVRRFEKVAHADFLNRMLYNDTKIFMVNLNLNYNDKMSMAVSTEVRVPFLDWELAEWVAWNVPPALKLRGKTTKHIFREAMRPLLPEEVLRQKKAGFGAPVDHWLAHDLREMTDDLLLSETGLAARGLFRPEAVRKMIGSHRSGWVDSSMQIWQLLTLELWYRKFIDRAGR